MSDRLAHLERKVADLLVEINHLRREARQRNLQIDALYHVWCSGGCRNGVLRYQVGGAGGHIGPVTEEVVQLAEKNTARLRRWWENKKCRMAKERKEN